MLHRLTGIQYRNAVSDLIAEDAGLVGPLEPDDAFAGLLSVGAGRATVSQWGVEQYETAAYSVAGRAMEEPRRSALVTCTPEDVIDARCAADFIARFGRSAWRRPLEGAEVGRLVSTATEAASVLGDFYAGLEFAIAAVLESPHFLFRVELGETDPNHPAERRYTSLEMATRLSFLLWNTTPDAALLDAGERGVLSTDEGLEGEVRRLLDSPRSREGVRSFFTDLFELYTLDDLVKDPVIFTPYSRELGPLAREETLRGLEHAVFDLDGDYRDAFTSEITFVDRRLAAIYGVRASARIGLGPVSLTKEGGRRGLLGQVSVLARQAHPVSSSATRRGKFVRQVLLCQDVPPPPVNVNTALPEPSGTARTLRERVQEHLVNPSCSGCHVRMDPIGLGLEEFDGIGRFRTEDHGAAIDPRSDLDGTSFSDAWDLARVIRGHPDLPRCLVRNLYRYATGTVESAGEIAQVDALTRKFERSEFRIRSLLFDIAMSPGFRRTKEPAE